MPYLVDGNNLAHALGLSKEGFADRGECARRVADFCRRLGSSATVVFDGPAPGPGDRPSSTERTTLRFSEGRSADEVILALVARSKTPRDFIVVTSDKPLGDRARHHGAQVERAHEFARRLGKTGRSDGKGDSKPVHRESAAEIDDWLVRFSGGDPTR